MATLTTDTPRVYELGDIGEHPVIAGDIIYEGAAVGLQASSGNARPLEAGDTFIGRVSRFVEAGVGVVAFDATLIAAP